MSYKTSLRNYMNTPQKPSKPTIPQKPIQQQPPKPIPRPNPQPVRRNLERGTDK